MSGGPAIASAVLVLAFGAVAAWMLGLRSRMLLVVASLPTAIGTLVLTAQILGMLGVTSTLPMVAGLTLTWVAAIGGARRLWQRDVPDAVRPAEEPGRLPWTGAAVGAAVAVSVWLSGIGAFWIPPQATDDIWHGYLIERLTHMSIVTASTVAPAFADSPGPVVYYQYGLHLAGALSHQLTGISVAEILNGTWLVNVGALLPFGLAAASWRLFPARPWVAFWSGTFAGSVAIFPYITNGILPYTSALAMVPGILALVLALQDPRARVPSTVVALAALGVFVTHPSAAVAAAVLVALVTVEQLLRRRSDEHRWYAERSLAVTGVLAVIVASPWLLASGDVGLGTPPAGAAVDGLISAGGMFAGLATPWTPPLPVLAVLTATGVIAAVLTRRGVGIAAGLLGFGGLYVGVLAGVDAVSAAANPWHGHWHRVIAIVGLLVPILAALGTATGFLLVRRAADSLLPTSRRARAVSLVTVLLASAIALTAAFEAARAQSIVRSAWHSSGLVTAADVDLFRDLGTRVGPTDRVLNSPVDGSTWMYALFGAIPVLPYSGGSNLNLPELYRGEGEYADAGVACRLISTVGATHAITKRVRGDDPGDNYNVDRLVKRFPELFTPIVRTESSAAYRIDQEALARCAGS